MKKKIILTIAFLISLLPMLLNQYGGIKGVQEISDLINLFNPIGIKTLFSKKASDKVEQDKTIENNTTE